MTISVVVVVMVEVQVGKGREEGGLRAYVWLRVVGAPRGDRRIEWALIAFSGDCARIRKGSGSFQD